MAFQFEFRDGRFWWCRHPCPSMVHSRWFVDACLNRWCDNYFYTKAKHLKSERLSQDGAGPPGPLHQASGIGVVGELVTGLLQ